MINDIVGEMKLFSIDFYYNKCSPANIVSLHRLGEVDRVRTMMDTEKEKSIKVTMPNGRMFKFVEGND